MFINFGDTKNSEPHKIIAPMMKYKTLS